MNGKAVRAAREVASPNSGNELKSGQNRCDQEFAPPAEHPVSNDRRSLLAVLTGLIGAAITSFLGVNLGRFSIAPAFASAKDSDWIDVAPLETFPDGKPKNQTVLVTQSAGWGHFTSEQSVWVTRKGEQVAVFSSVCPHLGCTINENSNGFGCVCHNSSWTREGQTSGGPTPRGMDRLEHKVENGMLKVKYQMFQQGLTEKIVAS